MLLKRVKIEAINHKLTLVNTEDLTFSIRDTPACKTQNLAQKF